MRLFSSYVVRLFGKHNQFAHLPVHFGEAVCAVSAVGKESQFAEFDLPGDVVEIHPYEGESLADDTGKPDHFGQIGRFFEGESVRHVLALPGDAEEIPVGVEVELPGVVSLASGAHEDVVHLPRKTEKLIVAKLTKIIN